jgi:serine/threonine protein kinase
MYQAPEILQKQYYRGECADIFSMGVILIIMVTGTLPYLGEANIKDPLYQYVKSKQPEEFWNQWKILFKSQSDEDSNKKESNDVIFTSDDSEA